MTTATIKTASEINAAAARECKRRGCTWFVVPFDSARRTTYHRTRPTGAAITGLVWRAVRGATGNVDYFRD